jgi:hypothetical protein
MSIRSGLFQNDVVSVLARGSTLNGALTTLTESPRSLEADRLAHERRDLLDLVGGERHLRRPALGVGDAAVVDHHRGVQPLDIAGRALDDTHGLVDLVVRHRLAPAAVAAQDSGHGRVQRLRRAGERRGRRDRRLV